MEYVGLDAILLFVLSVPIVMKYRVLPVTGTPYWLFGILFLLLIINLIVSLYPTIISSQKSIKQLKSVITWVVLIIVVGGTTITAIIDRSKTAPIYGVHDIILQQEQAMRYLLEGKNPYNETYFGTPLEQWNYAEMGKPAQNPALYHFVMTPWYLLFPYIFYFITVPAVGFFDGRIPLLFTLFGLLFVLSRWYKNSQIRLLAMIMVALSPGAIDFFVEGRSDTFVLFWLVWSFYLLEKRRLLSSSVLFGLALVSKQTAWIAVPFYLAYAYRQSRVSTHIFMKLCLTALFTAAVVSAPFLLWDAKAFMDSVVWYLSGNTANSYPVSGYGLGMILVAAGIIRNIHDYYPFVVWQTIIGIPVLYIILRWYAVKPGMSRLLLGYGLFLAIIWYFSRYFNNSHITYIGSILSLGVLKYWDDRATV